MHALGGNPPWTAELERVLSGGAAPRAIMLVEGVSDQVAVEALAKRRGRDLGAEGAAVMPIGGASVIGRVMEQLGHRGLDIGLAGLCDEAQERDFQRGLARAGLGSDLTRAEMERLGFFVCVADLEDELIRAVGVDRAEQVIDDQGELGSWHIFQKQPAQRGRPASQQLRRFIGTRAGRKAQYARLLVEALDLTRVPRPLDGVLAHV